MTSTTLHSPLRAALALTLSLLGPPLAHAQVHGQERSVSFDWFEYTGRDPVFEQPLPPHGYRNPILAGFFPDPAVTRVRNKFYLVNSTFTYFPGIPVSESTDLIHWHQVGSVIDRPTELTFDGLGVSRGIFAPSIQFHEGLFYVLATAVDAGGNFLATSPTPAGPWSDPIWLRDLDGIDPSLFFDDDGRTYLLNNGPPAGTPQYDGHRAIWIQEFDLRARKPVGPRRVLINGGVNFAEKPVWIEGPHLYKREGWYYLMCAEGGTTVQHSEVVLRSRSPWGPFEPYAGNPILTQRDLAADRPDPIADAGHADLVEAPDGGWWAIFLAVRPYEQVHYNLGRETFLLPVTWTGGWPVILPAGQAIPYVAAGPLPGAATLAGHAATAPTTGNFTWRDDFHARSLRRDWLMVRTPTRSWWDTGPAGLRLHPLAESLDTLGNPSFLARRQQHLNFTASTEFKLPAGGGIAAGMGVFQNENHWYFFGTRRRGHGLEVFLEKDNGRIATIGSMTVPTVGRIKLKVTGQARRYAFFYATDATGWHALVEGEDGSILSTDVAGGFVGAVIGPYARSE